MIFAKLYQCLVLIILPICLLAATTPDVEDPLMNLYKKYKVVYTGSKGISLRRFLKNNDEYQNHIKRLKDVNGFKSHNVALRNGDQPDVNKTIYVNNPVESKLPQAFMSFEKFKEALIDRAQKDKDALKRSILRAQLIKRWIVTTKRYKRIPTRTIKIEDVFKNVREQNREYKDIGPILSDLQLMQKNLKKDHIKYKTRSHKGQSRAYRKKPPTNSKTIKEYKKDVIIKHTITTLRVQSRQTQNITEIYSTNTKNKKALLNKHISKVLESGNIRTKLIDSAIKGIKQNLSRKAQNRESRHITTNPTKHSTNVRMTQKQKNIDVKITKPLQAIAQTAINKSTIKKQIEISSISDHKVLKTSVKDAEATLASSAKAFYLRAEETTLRNVTETSENATSSISSSRITTESKNAKKLASTVEVDVTTKIPPNFVGTKSTAATKLVIVTKSTVSILPVEAKIVTNMTNNAPRTGEPTRNVKDNAKYTEGGTINMAGNAKNTAEASVNVTENDMRARKITTSMTESSARAKESATNVTENATDATKTPKIESMSSETEEEEEQDDTKTPTTPTTTTVLTQHTLGRPRVFMGR